MSATVETPIVPGPVQGPTREEPLIEALLLDEYRSLVHLAYLILPPAISRARRVAAAHAVVQRALPADLAVPAMKRREFLRDRVVQEATRQAAERSLLARLGSVIAPADGLGFEPCTIRPDRSTITRRCARGRRLTVLVTLLLTAGILAGLLLT
ncbi:hypothetical protein [Kribbella kalugense]|uniref:Uncharacterized protein n=1 Tax=Kribbella kalugense TaxID=2512221 RepID=A0A4R7ZDR1_9ACTN|nr:hypothetical protein [Kribbella kalugense]TDW15046.1 hypothetical protein EV650_6526 [Kribbella kalugense]